MDILRPRRIQFHQKKSIGRGPSGAGMVTDGSRMDGMIVSITPSRSSSVPSPFRLSSRPPWCESQ